MKRNRAFTLIELLVVIAIIGLLLAIIMPSLQKAKLAVESVICRSNLRQYGMAGKMYLDDYNSKFPNAWDSIFKSRDPNRGCQWHDLSRYPDNDSSYAGTLWSYIGAGDVHICPTFKRFAMTGEPHPGHVDSIPIDPLFCYSMNAFLGGFEATNSKKLQLSMSQIKAPTRVFFFAEENGWRFVPDHAEDPIRYRDTLNDNALCGGPKLPYEAGAWDLPLTQGPPYRDCFGSFHKTTMQKRNDGLANAVFLDNHVDLVDPERTYYYTRPLDSAPPM